MIAFNPLEIKVLKAQKSPNHLLSDSFMLIFKISPLIGCVAFSNLIFNDCPFPNLEH